MDVPDGTGLAQLFADIAKDLDAQADVTATLEETVRLAVDVVPGCDYAGVSFLAPGSEIETPTFTDEKVKLCHAAQFTFGEGPSVQAGLDGESYIIENMSAETRWPRFARRAAELGMGSMLACQLTTPRRTIGVLNLYAQDPGAFDEQSLAVAMIYAAHASISLARQRLEAQLRTALKTRGVIGQAVGILIERHRLTPRSGFDLLVRASQERHIKVRDLAEIVVATGEVGPAAPKPEG